MRKFLSLLLTMAMVLSLAVTVNAAAPKEDITILHTNDVHCDYEKYAKVATLHKSADLLVDAGDHVQGGVIGTLSKGEYIVDIMNYLKYDAAVPGNHEFDYGMDQFLHIAKDLAKYPYISANFTGKDGKPYFDAYKMFEVKGVPEEVAREALRLAQHKLPIKTKIVAAKNAEQRIEKEMAEEAALEAKWAAEDAAAAKEEN